MADDGLTSEMRLQAMEYALNQLYVNFFEHLGIPTPLVQIIQAEALSTLAGQTFPDLTSDASDHASAELYSAVERLFKLQLSMLVGVRLQKK